ncbi:MAG TPA: AAC(3) family N-acetyltransferase [Gemmatimonadaceae bacterium]|nr:AAC(3) family N-acetyltransferase [Gemmatimonadaceae bacterium]
MSASAAIAGLLSGLGSGPVFVHSDPFRAASLVPRTKDRSAFTDSHIDLLHASTDGRSLWMPAFNYDFPRTKSFDVANDESQLGPIPERFRTRVADWRTPIPIFSASGTGKALDLEWGEKTDPFGDDSLFSRLVETDGVILYYGDTFHYNTIVHYAERVAGGPAYRYDKMFPGIVTDGRRSKTSGSLNYHVRPMGMGLEYDWSGLLSRALNAGACIRSEEYSQLLASDAGTLTQFFVDEMRTDPLALLDTDTRSWVEPKLDQLGRRFELEDFETPSA